MNASECIIVCEGYQDRAFLAGALTVRSWQSWKGQVYGPLGRPLEGIGQYAFHRPTERWVRIIPAGSDARVTTAADAQVELAKTRPVERIVLVWDDDSMDQPGTARNTAFENWAMKHGGTSDGATDDFRLAGTLATTRLSSIVWGASADPLDAHLPAKQTLERLVCASIEEARPGRAPYVSAWLAGRPDPPAPATEKLHKTHAASHMAGWYSERGMEGLFRSMWEDINIRAALDRRLAAIGATRILDALEVAAP